MTLSALTRLLAEGGIEDAEVEARLLLSHFFGVTPATLLADRDRSYESEALANAVRLRLAREPLAYILGEVYFYEESYLVSPACLIPRSDTELLVEQAIALLPRGARFADLCTGSGCIAVSVLAHRPDLSALAVDVSEDALTLAQKNAERNGVRDRVDFLKADLLSDEIAALSSFDLVLSNPPYINSAVVPTLSPEVKCEPSLALDGGEDGLIFYRAMLQNLSPRLFLLEIGYDQGEALTALARSHGYKAEIRKDLGGNDRLAVLKRD